jgi:hypothetical protein
MSKLGFGDRNKKIKINKDGYRNWDPEIEMETTP